MFFEKKRDGVRFKYDPRKNFSFCFILIFRFTIVIKLTNFEFAGHQNTIIFFDKKMMSDLIMFCETVSDLV